MYNHHITPIKYNPAKFKLKGYWQNIKSSNTNTYVYPFIPDIQSPKRKSGKLVIQNSLPHLKHLLHSSKKLDAAVYNSNLMRKADIWNVIRVMLYFLREKEVTQCALTDMDRWCGYPKVLHHILQALTDHKECKFSLHLTKKSSISVAQPYSACNNLHIYVPKNEAQTHGLPAFEFKPDAKNACCFSQDKTQTVIYDSAGVQLQSKLHYSNYRRINKYNEDHS